MTSTHSIYTFDTFIEDLDRVVSGETDDHAAVATVEPLLERLILAGGIPEEFCVVPGGARSEDDRYEFYVYRLYRGPGDSFNVTTAIWPVGAGTGVHDHGGFWLVEGVYRNTLELTTYRRLDDGTVSGRAQLEALPPQEITPGQVAHIISPESEIHEWTNRSDEPTVTVHVWNADASNQTVKYFDLDAGTYSTVTHDVSFENE
jgi:predicted metal-dependent enzyme (double-stranded beta helix superfamily)